MIPQGSFITRFKPWCQRRERDQGFSTIGSTAYCYILGGHMSKWFGQENTTCTYDPVLTSSGDQYFKALVYYDFQ